MIVRSPRPSDGTEQRASSRHPGKTYVCPWLVPGVQNPFLRQDANMSPFTDVQSAWTFSPQRRKFDFLKWDENRLAEPLRFHSLTRLEPVLLPEGKEAAFLKPHVSTTFSHVRVVKGTPSGSCRQPSMLYRDGSRMEQRQENVLTSHGHPTRETQDRTKSTGEVERLQDNRGGFKCGYLQQRL